MGAVAVSVVAAVDVAVVVGVFEVAVMEVAGVEVSGEVGISVVAVETGLAGDVLVDVVVVVDSEVIPADTGVVPVVNVASECVGETEGGGGGPLVVGVPVLVVTGVAVVGVGGLGVSVGVIEDVTGGVDVIPVVRDSVEASLVGAGVVLQVDVA